MEELLLEINIYLEQTLMNLGIWAPIFSCVLIMLESIIAILPLFVFVSINIIALGPFIGFIVSWISTIIGCILIFYITKNIFHQKFENYILKKNKFKKSYEIINHLSISQITLILSIPFTPSFILNIVAGLSNIKLKSYLLALIIGKFFTVIFWGFIGTSLLESIQDPKTLITIGIMLLSAYGVSLIIKKIFKI